MGVTSWITSKLLFTLMIFIGFYIIGEMLGIVPQPLKNMVSWFANNFLTLGFIIISILVLLVVYRALGKRRGSGTT